MGKSGTIQRRAHMVKQDTNAKRYARCIAQRDAYPYLVRDFNFGTHWRVDIDGAPFDFWPHTGRYLDPRAPAVTRGTARDFDDFIRTLTKPR